MTAITNAELGHCTTANRGQEKRHAFLHYLQVHHRTHTGFCVSLCSPLEIPASLLEGATFLGL